MSLIKSLLKITKVTQFDPAAAAKFARSFYLASPALRRQKLSPPSTPYSAFDMAPPSILQLTVLGNGYLGSPKTIVVRSERGVYIFNCGEGTQRSLIEFSGGIGRIENIFFTGNSWDHVGGTVGMFLTLKDAKGNINSSTLSFHGPPNVGKLIPFFRDCEFDADVKTVDNILITQHDGRKESWTDDCVSVKYIPLTTKTATSRKEEDEEEEEEKNCDDGGAESFAYVVDAAPLKPKLDMFKAMKLKIPKGPLLGKLVNGESVTLEDGRVVTSAEVTLPPATCGSVAIVDIAKKEQLESLTRHPAWKGLRRPAVVVHLSPDDILSDPDYIEWANGLGGSGDDDDVNDDDPVDSRRRPSVTHLLVSPTAAGFPSYSSARHQFKLNRVEPDFFPLLPYQTTTFSTTPSPPPSSLVQFLPASILCQVGFEMKVRPPEDFSSLATGAPKKWTYDESEYSREIEEESPDLDEALEDFRKKMAKTGEDRRGNPWPQVVFLGTTSAIPLKDRNVTGILVRRSSTESIVLDCGEGTTLQIMRKFGDQADLIFRSINLVFISHNHTDHHIGLPGLILARRSVFEKASISEPPLFLIIPQRIETWLTKFDQEIVRILENVHIINSQAIFNSKYDPEVFSKLKDRTKIRSIQVCYVHHCSQAFGISITDEKGWKLTFSGDTKPCEHLVKMGIDSDLLIHEATMEDGWEEEAESKRHSTTSQAIQIGKEMKAKLILLTHFSGRYAKMVPLPKEENLLNNVGLAHDFASYSFLRDTKSIPLVIEPLQKMFAKYLEDNLQKSLKRQLRLEDELHAKKLKKEPDQKQNEGNISPGNSEEIKQKSKSQNL